MGDLGTSTPMGGSILLEGPTPPAEDADKVGVTVEDVVTRATSDVSGSYRSVLAGGDYAKAYSTTI